MKKLLIATLLFSASNIAFANQDMVYTGEAKQWSIETREDAYQFRTYDANGNLDITIHVSDAKTDLEKRNEIAKKTNVEPDALKEIKKGKYTAFNYTQDSFPKNKYHIYFTLDDKTFFIHWFDTSPEAVSGMNITNYLDHLQLKSSN